MDKATSVVMGQHWHSKEITRAGKTVQLVECQLCRHGDLGWTPKSRGKMSGMVVQGMGGSPKFADRPAPWVSYLPLRDVVSKEMDGTPEGDT